MLFKNPKRRFTKAKVEAVGYPVTRMEGVFVRSSLKTFISASGIFFFFSNSPFNLQKIVGQINKLLFNPQYSYLSCIDFQIRIWPYISYQNYVFSTIFWKTIKLEWGIELLALGINHNHPTIYANAVFKKITNTYVCYLRESLSLPSLLPLSFITYGLWLLKLIFDFCCWVLTLIGKVEYKTDFGEEHKVEIELAWWGRETRQIWRSGNAKARRWRSVELRQPEAYYFWVFSDLIFIYLRWFSLPLHRRNFSNPKNSWILWYWFS